MTTLEILDPAPATTEVADALVHTTVVDIAARIKAGHVVHIADDVLVLIKREWQGMERGQS